MKAQQTIHQIIVLIIVALSASLTAHAAIGLDVFTTGASPGTTAGFSSLTFQHTIGSGANRVLLVAACREGNDSFPELGITGITYGGQPMTQVAAASLDVVEGTVRASNDIYYMLESDLPAAGPYDVVITLPGDVSWICAAAISLTGAAQLPPEVATANSVIDPNVDPTITTAITTLTDGAWVVDAVMCGAGAENSLTEDQFVTTETGMVKRGVSIAQSAAMAMATRPVATAGNVSMGWQKLSDAFRLVHSLVALAPAPPANPDDTDGDGLLDEDETNTYQTDPQNPDSDGDGLTDYEEVFWNGNADLDAYHPTNNPTGTDTDPNVADTDGDGASDGAEDRFGTDPLDPNDTPAVPATGLIGLGGAALTALGFGVARLRRKRR